MCEREEWKTNQELEDRRRWRRERETLQELRQCGPASKREIIN